MSALVSAHTGWITIPGAPPAWHRLAPSLRVAYLFISLETRQSRLLLFYELTWLLLWAKLNDHKISSSQIASWAEFFFFFLEDWLLQATGFENNCQASMELWERLQLFFLSFVIGKSPQTLCSFYSIPSFRPFTTRACELTAKLHCLLLYSENTRLTKHYKLKEVKKVKKF